MITTVEAANWQLHTLLALRQTAKCAASSICPLVMAEWPTPASRGGVKFDNLCIKQQTYRPGVHAQTVNKVDHLRSADADQGTGTHHCSVSGGSSKQIVSDCTRLKFHVYS